MSNTDLSTCPFLRVPKEIRLHIYRELIMPSTYLSILPEDDEDEDPWADIDEFTDTHASDFDEEDEPGLDGGREYITAEEARALARRENEHLKRDPTILRVNKQIFDEASSLMYTEGILQLFPGDIFCLAKFPGTLKFGAPSEENPWRHNPLLGFEEKDGVVKYSKTAMKGKMEPHIFAKFERLCFHANFDFEQTQNVELWIDDKTGVVRSEDAAKYKKLLRNSKIMSDFVKIISKSPQINSLEINLEVEVMADSELMQADMMGDEEDDDAEEAMEKDVDKFMEMSNERATELFVDSGICEPLLKLRNVRNLDFHFGFDHRDEEEKYRPLPRQLALIAEWKKEIEGNFEEVVV